MNRNWPPAGEHTKIINQNTVLMEVVFYKLLINKWKIDYKHCNWKYGLQSTCFNALRKFSCKKNSYKYDFIAIDYLL